ncbi:CUB domain-containing protein 1 isoform X2 [Poeciliopsis prolifica]|uniref:CUB domain-containing protein 1 isoform X2 n=1 Tax=Poeciliopsis prolifica TaxID=188132 RepID=UPI002413DF9E|nr:CUB domain-containing protein 1 isoform X2 [Poeciliopsis prolifica]
MRFCGACALLALLLVSSLDSSESLQTTVKPNKGSDVIVSSLQPDCTVCTISGVNGNQTSCQLSLKLEPEEEVKLLFQCPQPVEQSYNVTIISLIECTKDACKPPTVEVQSSLLPTFSRTFSWKLKAPEKTLVSLKVIGNGLSRTPHPCNDGRQYSVLTSETSKEVPTQYCEGGSETQLDLSDQGVVSLEAKPNTQVESVLFQAFAAPMKRVMTVTIGPASTVVLTRDPGKDECEVCVSGGASPDCHATEKTLKSAEKLPLEFRCLKPEDVFTMKMTTKIECTQTSCTPASAEVDLDLFKGFKKTLTWDVTVPDRTVLTLEFPGLKEKSASEDCEDGIQYTVTTMRTDGQMRTNSYCKHGPVSQLDLFGNMAVTVEVSKEGEPDQTVFNTTAAPRRGRSTVVNSDPNMSLIITKVDKEADCQVCVTEASKQTCTSETLKRLKNPRNASVEFMCLQPQKVYTVEINREIDCTKTSCSGNAVHVNNEFFSNYNRTFTWDIKVQPTQTFHLDFPGSGLRQIPNEGTCPDGHTYSVILYLHRASPATIGTFCKGGTVTSILGQYKGRVMLTVPSDVTLDPMDFQLKIGPQSEATAIVKVNLPRGTSDTEFITPNYPKDFPDEKQILWEFSIPGMHNYSVKFSEHSAPECLNEGDVVVVEYQQEGKKPTRTALTDPQPQHQQGAFNLTLKNCKTNQTLPGLSLRYSVSVMRSGHPVLCTVDLTKGEAVSVQIEKVGADPLCEMKKDSVEKKTINVAKGETAKLSFLDCPSEDLRLTASKLIACANASLCTPTPLSIPTLDSCLPMPLHSFSWLFTIPHEATLDLVSPTGSLRQSLPGQECDPSSVLRVDENDGSFIGDFCSDGVIQKLQVHSNISITVTPRDLRRSEEPLLNVSVSPEIKEDIIYRISPNLMSPTILATPNWPNGMKAHSSVSWIVDLPWMTHALVKVDISGLECKHGHARINMKHQEEGNDLLDIGESEKTSTTNMTARQSFYLNLTNCQPEGSDQFNVKATINLERKTNLLPILLGLVGAVLLLLLILTVVCIVVRKKKSKMASQASIYMGKGNIFRPNDRHFVKTRADNDSHVYDYIDDSMVYGHLLTDSEITSNGVQVDSYQTFTGPSDRTLPVIKEPDPEPEKGQYQSFLSPSDTFMPPRPRTPIERQDSLGFQDRRMLDNELYTFKSTGDMNTIRLSGVDMEPQPPIMEESL